ncbi:uncharacterized protein LOC116175788 [Photinus pyralis]|uniref:uncharacterized protein LOC116175788 n=1 Tax=Photinus pyralis TaxID=7054 RepID=UPI00126711E7|nr:uncharacterized protein LOC116175788 [Photinus pyralis]
MKLFAVFFCLIACSFAATIQNEHFALDADMRNGLIYVKEAQLFGPNGVVFEMKRATVEGFSDITHGMSFEMNSPLTTVKVAVSLPRIFGHVGFWNSSLPLFYGSGSAAFDLRRPQVVMEVTFNMTSMLFEPVVFKPSIKEVHFEMTGVNNDEEYSREFSQKVRQALEVLVNDPEVHASVAEKITAFLNGQYRSSPPRGCWWCPLIRTY